MIASFCFSSLIHLQCDSLALIHTVPLRYWASLRAKSTRSSLSYTIRLTVTSSLHSASYTTTVLSQFPIRNALDLATSRSFWTGPTDYDGHIRHRFVNACVCQNKRSFEHFTDSLGPSPQGRAVTTIARPAPIDDSSAIADISANHSPSLIGRTVCSHYCPGSLRRKCGHLARSSLLFISASCPIVFSYLLLLGQLSSFKSFETKLGSRPFDRQNPWTTDQSFHRPVEAPNGMPRKNIQGLYKTLHHGNYSTSTPERLLYPNLNIHDPMDRARE